MSEGPKCENKKNAAKMKSAVSDTFRLWGILEKGEEIVAKGEELSGSQSGSRTEPEKQEKQISTPSFSLSYSFFPIFLSLLSVNCD